MKCTNNKHNLTENAATGQMIAKGDEKAFADFFRAWQPFLTTHIYRITQSFETTEEIVQDVFLKIWQNRVSLSEVKNMKSYLIIVSRNHAINALKKKAAEYKKQLQYNREQSVVESCTNETDLPPAFSLIDEAINRLTEKQRDVFLLHRHHRLTYQQIADRMGIGKESVKTHISLAVKNISVHLKKWKTLLFCLLVYYFF